MRVLIVEDDEDVRRYIHQFLETEGYEVADACNGLEALQFLKTHRAPDVILLDLWMPVMDGISFRSVQLRNEKLSGIPIVVLSAGRDAKKRAELLGANSFLAKPPDLRQLVDTIERFHH
jgi:CheY-like chemotaxis protein